MTTDCRFHHAMIAAVLCHGAGLIGIGWLQREHVNGGGAEGNLTAKAQLELSVVELDDLSGRLRASVVTSPASPVVGLLGQPRRAVAAVSSAGRLATRDGAENNVVGGSELVADEAESLAIAASSAAPLTQPLTRENLGLGVGDYSRVPAPSPMQAEQQMRQALNQKLEQSLRQDAEEQAGELGLGKEGPILARITQLTRQNPVDLSGFATIHVRLLKGGNVELDLLGTSSDRLAWTRLLQQAKADLLALKLAPPEGSRGVDLLIRVDSRVQLPSGADPGFSVKAFGVPLRKGKGSRSNGVELLSSLPKLELDESATSEGEHGQSARLKFDVLKMPLDPVDLFGQQSRNVSAHVLKRTVL